MWPACMCAWHSAAGSAAIVQRTEVCWRDGACGMLGHGEVSQHAGAQMHALPALPCFAAGSLQRRRRDHTAQVDCCDRATRSPMVSPAGRRCLCSRMKDGRGAARARSVLVLNMRGCTRRGSREGHVSAAGCRLRAMQHQLVRLVCARVS